MKIVLLFLLLLSLSKYIFAQSFDDNNIPWEAEDVNSIKDLDSTSSVSTLNVMIKPIDLVVNLYQTDISDYSIQRCPFKISCSNFARMAMKIHGFYGIFIFMDRYFFRENMSAFKNYNYVIVKGVLKLDDSFYLH